MSDPAYKENPPTVREQNAEAFEDMVDALDHIARVCYGSRTSTRRLRWIASRARCAIEGGADWRDLNIPKKDPRAEAAENMIALIYPVVVDSIAGLEDEFVDDDGDIDDDEIRDELDAMNAFVDQAKHLPVIRRMIREASNGTE